MPLQVVELDKVAIDETDMAHARTDKCVGDYGAQRPAAADERAGGKQSLLAFFAQGREAHLTVVASQFKVQGLMFQVQGLSKWLLIDDFVSSLTHVAGEIAEGGEGGLQAVAGAAAFFNCRVF